MLQELCFSEFLCEINTGVHNSNDFEGHFSIFINLGGLCENGSKEKEPATKRLQVQFGLLITAFGLQ